MTSPPRLRIPRALPAPPAARADHAPGGLLLLRCLPRALAGHFARLLAFQPQTSTRLLHCAPAICPLPVTVDRTALHLPPQLTVRRKALRIDLGYAVTVSLHRG